MCTDAYHIDAGPIRRCCPLRRGEYPDPIPKHQRHLPIDEVDVKYERPYVTRARGEGDAGGGLNQTSIPGMGTHGGARLMLFRNPGIPASPHPSPLP